jgi:cytoskeleton protein RodZ
MSAGLLMSEGLEETGVTAGGLLKEARQAAGVHIAALAVALKVPVSKLEALEADNYEALPDTVFVRALASSMCRTLKLDPAPVLSLLPQSKSPRLATGGGGLNAPVKVAIGKSSTSSASFSSRSTSRSVSLIVVALLVGALVLVFLPRQSDDAAGLSTAPALSTPAANTGVEPYAGAAVVAASDSPPASPVPAPGGAGTSVVELAQGATAVNIPVANGVASAPLAAASPAASASGVLVLRARSESWVQVRDATGALALQRNLAAGETVSVAGPAPLAVVVGRADATEVLVRGKPFDLAAVSRENVARFEVK